MYPEKEKNTLISKLLKKKLPPLGKVWGFARLSYSPVFACIFIGLILLVTIYKRIHGIPLGALEILTLSLCAGTVVVVFVAWLSFIIEPDEEDSESEKDIPATQMESCSAKIGFAEPLPSRPLPESELENLSLPQNKVIRLSSQKKPSYVAAMTVILLGIAILISGIIYLRKGPEGEIYTAQAFGLIVLGAILVLCAPSTQKTTATVTAEPQKPQELPPSLSAIALLGKGVKILLLTAAIIFGGCLLFFLVCFCLFPFVLFIDETGNLTAVVATVITLPLVIWVFYLVFRQKASNSQP